MKINEVEERVGIAKRNIRFYEKEGLLTPARNSENGYRDYGEEDVRTLEKIKLLRKLDVPLEEIRRLQQGLLTLDDVLRRHIIQLRRKEEDLATTEALCRRLSDTGGSLSSLDAGAWLREMARMEEEGSRFMNTRTHDPRTRYAGPVAAALAFTVLMAGLLALIIWGFTTSPADAPPLGIVLVLAAAPLVLIAGVLLALVQRIRQIKGGEEDDAAQY